MFKKNTEKRYIGLGVNIKALDAISTTPAYKTKEEINKRNYPIIIEIKMEKKENMKILNILLLTLAFAILSSMALSLVLMKYLPVNIAGPLSFIGSLILGFKSRSIVEKIIGQTLLEAIEETSKEIEKNNKE